MAHTLAAGVGPLFAGWDEALIWACLDGCMGEVATDGRRPPRAARITTGDFSFFAGEPDDGLIASASAAILVPRDAAWARAIGRVLGDGVERGVRYAVCKEPAAFDRARLARLAASLDGAYRLVPMDARLAALALSQPWSRDFCALFDGPADYARRGIGVAALRGEALVAGASSYAVYGRARGAEGGARRRGIEIQIDTREDHRRRGLATACGAALILACLARGLYPSWDAHDLRSVALAEKLGYRRKGPYPVYRRRD